ncbi:MAG TPA: DUF4384 domain-containing protein [Gemmatimonadales bacterium]|nr:DUF4384 domain-containing protein [Gemmatimonadales bacterium]
MTILSALLPLLGAIVAPATAPEARPTPTVEPPVRLWMNSDRRFREGELARVQVDAEVDGYLLVLNYDPFGRLRVLFPLDPRDDTRVLAGRRYEVRDEEGRGAFRANGDGPGLIYTALAPGPWRLEEIVAEGRWDHDRLALNRSSDDPEADITELVQRLSGPEGFDYDVMDYRVYGESRTTTVIYENYGPGPYVYDYLSCYDWSWGYRGCGRFPFDGGWSFGVGFFGYDPYYYSRYPYRYRYYGYTPYFPYGPISPRRPRAVITGRPRDYVVNRIPSGFRGRTERPSSGAVLPPAIDWRDRAGARPAGGREPGAARGPTGRERGAPPVARPVRSREPVVSRQPIRRESGAPPSARPVRSREPVVFREPARREGAAPPEARSASNREPVVYRGSTRRESFPPPSARPSRGERGPEARPARPEGRSVPVVRGGGEPRVREGNPSARSAPRSVPSGARNGGGGNSGGGQVRGNSGGGGHSRPRRP